MVHMNESFDDKYDLVIVVDELFDNLIEINSRCRLHGIKMISCNVRGVCGLVFNDFLTGFHVTDTDGENYRDVLLERVDIVHSTGLGKVKLRIECIHEETLKLGLGDSAEVMFMMEEATSMSDGQTKDIQRLTVTVESVLNPRSVQAVVSASSVKTQDIQHLISSASSLVLKKVSVVDIESLLFSDVMMVYRRKKCESSITSRCDID